MLCSLPISENQNKTESCSLSESFLKEDTGFFVAFQTNLGILPMLSTLYWGSIQEFSSQDSQKSV